MCVCVCVCLCVCLCVCPCLSVCLGVGVMMTQICNRYYKEKVIYKDIFSVPIIQNAYKSHRVSFFGGGGKYKCTVSCEG